VHTVARKYNRVICGFIQVQSSKYSAEYLEWRINNVLQKIKGKEGGFTDESVENVKAAQIKLYKQVPLSIGEEANEHWGQLEDENFNFDHEERMIEALGRITTKQVTKAFDEMFFTNPRRLNIKICSEDHAKNAEEIENAKAENKKFYAQYGAKQNKVEDVASFAEGKDLFA